MTITTTGNVLQGTNVTPISAGYSLMCLQVPISTNPVAANIGLPLSMTSSPNDPPTQSANDTLYLWTGAGYQLYYYFNQADATSWENGGGSSPVYPAGFYAANGNPLDPSAYPQVNQGFFLYHSGATLQWTNTFTAQ
jgi:hypothetical protein